MKKFNRVLALLGSFILGLVVITGCNDALDDRMHVYFGNLHSHVKSHNLFDPKITVSQALDWAKYDAKFDFYAVTDHAELISKAFFDNAGAEVDAYNKDNSFVAIRGFEYSHTLEGHINVFGTDAMVNSLWMIHLPWFFTWLDDVNGFAQFNHPGSAGFIGTFYEFWYADKVADNMVAVETGNTDDGNNDGKYYKRYIQALDKGWKLAPTNNQDNHTRKTNCHRTAIIAQDLSYDNLVEALKLRRAYSTDDPDMQILFKCNDAWMGSDVVISESAATFTIGVKDNEPIAKLELITNEGLVAASQSFSCGQTEVTWTPTVDVVNGDYFFVRVTETNTIETADGATQVALTAPIWIKK